MPRLGEFYPGICLTTEDKTRKNLSQGKKNLSQVKKNLSQSTVYILPKHPHITKPTQTHTLKKPTQTYTHTHTHTHKNTHTHTHTFRFFRELQEHGLIRLFLLFLWFFGQFSGCGLPDLLPATFSRPCCRLPVPYLKEAYGILPNNIVPSTSRLSHVPSSSEVSCHYGFLYT